MAESASVQLPRAERRSPLAAFAPRFGAAGSDETVRLRELPFRAMIDVRLGADQAPVEARIQEALGLALPGALRSTVDADRGVLWLGPRWWLVVGPLDTAADTEHLLRDAVADANASVVDMSAQRTTLELAGPRARDVLMTGCSIDLHERAFPVGSCAQTLLGRAQVVLHRLDPAASAGAGTAGAADPTAIVTGDREFGTDAAGAPSTRSAAPSASTYRILMGASFAAYLTEWLLDALV